MSMKLGRLALVGCLALSFTIRADGIVLPSGRRLRSIAGPNTDTQETARALVPNATFKENFGLGMSSSSLATGTFAYSKCDVASGKCTVDAAKISAAMHPSGRLILLLGSSIDIYALDYFCKAANAPVTGFIRTPELTKYVAGNFAYCQIGGMNGKLTLAYSFHPGASGPPYYEPCKVVLGVECMHTPGLTAGIVQSSIAQAVQKFGTHPSAIIVDSTLWDAASWWAADGKPPEPYIAPQHHIDKWCKHDFPTFINTVQAASPTSKVAFRTAPRIKFAVGYGHSEENVQAMNQCLMTSSRANLAMYTMVDYNALVEQFLAAQSKPRSAFYEDEFHPAGILSVLYVDWLLQWVLSAAS